MVRDTSIIPIEAPKRKRHKAISQTDSTEASSGSIARKIKPETRMTFRHPKRPEINPVNGMESSDPTPTHRSNMPRTASSRPSRALAYGTSAAHEDTPTPRTR